jgi:glutamate-5-semialdehyde dehydrogenase
MHVAMSEAIPALCLRARIASRALARQATLEPGARASALRGFAASIRARAAELVEVNARDVADARRKGISAALLDRLTLGERGVADMARAVDYIAGLVDPLGAILFESTRPDGLRIRRVRVPIGVVAMIYEARPNVTAEAAALCVKSGNAAILRGGSEAARSNAAIHALASDALGRAGLPSEAVQILPPGDRDAIRELLQQTATVDLVIPRGGEALVRFVEENARVPVVRHGKGVCHLYVDAGADADTAARLAVNAKLQRPGVCNALECLLVDEADAARLLPPILAALARGGCELRGCERTRAIAPDVRAAADDDWGREYLAPVLAVRVVGGIAGALEHVARYGSGHTEAICTRDAANAERWRREVDAACVVVNASTRLHDGGELGLGAEIGIATSRLHWRGAMGLEALTTFKWVVEGQGQLRA